MFNVLLRFVVIAPVISVVYPHSLKLKNGNSMPILSFGTLGITDIVDQVIKQAVIEAIELGYRHINTAAIYKNEEQVGEAIADVISRGIVTREELFITTKLNARIGAKEGVVPAVEEALRKLKLDYIDAYLIHSPDNWFKIPVYDYVDIWKGMEEVKKLNLARYIGVSNFNSTHINKILVDSEIVPAVNEIEVSPTYASLELVAYCQSLNMTVFSYAPFGHMVPRPFSLRTVRSTFEEPVLMQIAKKYGKTPNQVVIRYLMDRDIVPMPRSTDAKHIKSNLEVFDFQLTPEEVYLINELDQDVRVYYFDKEPFEAVVDFYHL